MTSAYNLGSTQLDDLLSSAVAEFDASEVARTSPGLRSDILVVGVKP